VIREWTLEEAKTKRLGRFMKAFEMATKFVKVEPEYASDRFIGMMEAGICRIFVAETEEKEFQGAVSWIVVPDMFCGKPTAIEMFWFVHPLHHGKGIGSQLFDKFEAETMGMRRAMIHLSDSYPERLRKFYKDRGYTLLEEHYIREE
jgi:GNAT superfamily N-acetyltransferase